MPMEFGIDRKEYLETDEDGLKSIIDESLGNDFILKREMWGFHLLERRQKMMIRSNFLTGISKLSRKQINASGRDKRILSTGTMQKKNSESDSNENQAAFFGASNSNFEEVD